MLTACCDGTVVIDAALDLPVRRADHQPALAADARRNIVGAFNLGLASQVPPAAARSSPRGPPAAGARPALGLGSRHGPEGVPGGNPGVRGPRHAGESRRRRRPVPDGAGRSHGRAPPSAPRPDRGHTTPRRRHQLWYVQPAGPSLRQMDTDPEHLPRPDRRQATYPCSISSSPSTSPMRPSPSGDSGPIICKERAVIDSQAGDPAAIWQFTPGGYIVNSIDPNLVLQPRRKPVQHPGCPGLHGSTVVGVSLQVLQTYPCQLWTTTSDGIIYNQQNGQVLTVDGGFDPDGSRRRSRSSPRPWRRQPRRPRSGTSHPARPTADEVLAVRSRKPASPGPRSTRPLTTTSHTTRDTQLGLEGHHAAGPVHEPGGAAPSYQAGQRATRN